MQEAFLFHYIASFTSSSSKNHQRHSPLLISATTLLFFAVNQNHMTQFRRISLFIAITLWGVLIGAVVYSHVAFMPGYLHHLPGSTRLVTGIDAIQDARFWISIHPIALPFTILALVLHWKQKALRRFILYTTIVYILTLTVTALYFVPSLMEFATSHTNTAVSPAEWQQRGITWERLSWVRGAFMFTGFLSLLLALGSAHKQEAVVVVPKKEKRMREAAL